MSCCALPCRRDGSACVREKRARSLPSTWRGFSAHHARDSELPIASHSAVAASKRRRTSRFRQRLISVCAIPVTALRLDRNRQPRVWRNVRARRDRAARRLSIPRNRAAPARATQTVFVSLWEAKADFARGILAFGVRRQSATATALWVVVSNLTKSRALGRNY